MAQEKVRVYELAKKLELSNKEVMDLLEEKLNIKVKSHASTIEKSDADKLCNINAGKAPSPVKESPAPKVESRVEARPQEPAKQPPSPEQRPERFEHRQERPERFEDRRPPQQQGGQRPYEGQRRPEQPYQRQDRFQNNRPDQQRREYPPRPDQQRREYPQRPYDQRGPRPPQAGQDGAPQRYPDRQQQGDRPQRPPFRPQEDRPAFRQQGEGGRPPFRPQGERPPFRPHGEGGRPPFRPQGEGGRPPFRPQGERPTIPAKKSPAISREEPSEFSKTPSVRREALNKKKEKFNKEDLVSKAEKQENVKVLQERKKKKEAEKEKEKITEIAIDKPITVGELAAKLDINASDIIKELMMSGMLATVNQALDCCTAKTAVEKLGFTVVEAKEGDCCTAAVEIEEKEVIDEARLRHRAPVVTIMGHVDHGKTTLLDSIRAKKHKIVSTEVGGITQSIGAYTVKIDGKKIVFIDTPGHEAFTAMRARGAQTTDIAILVVAADDGIMPQTIESINHAKAAKIPIIVAVNKIDKPGADPDRVLQQLTEYELVPEAWGGDTVCMPVSAINGTNIDELLEMVLLVAEIQELKTDPDRNATGVIIEAKLDKGKGAVATLLVQSGTLKVGDFVVAGNVAGKVRALISDEGERLQKAGPSTPVEILGLSEVPQSGDKFEAVSSDKEMKNIMESRKEADRMTRLEAMAPTQIRREQLLQNQEENKELNIIIKANTHGSAEAVSAALQQLKSKQIFVKILHVGIGDISEADVMLASASNAIVLGFTVKEDGNATRAAATEGVDIRKYDIIYQIIEDIEKTMLGLLQPELKEVELGTAEVRQIFTIGKNVKIAGCYVLEGKIQRGKLAKVYRGGKEIFKGNIDQLKRFKDNVREVAQGYECGISFDHFNDLEEGDLIKVSVMEQVERETLV